MKSSTSSHFWTVPAEPASPQLPGLPTPPMPTIEVRCHRRLRGPYTAAGAVLRHAVPELVAIDRELVAARAAAIVTMAPELTALIPVAPQTLTNLASHEERTRFYPAVRTLRLSHGAAELLMDWARLAHPGGVVLSFLDLDDADPCDREFVSVLLRRCDPSLLTVIARPRPQTSASQRGRPARPGARPVRDPGLAQPPASARPPDVRSRSGRRAPTSPSSSSIPTARTRTRRCARPTRRCPPTSGQAAHRAGGDPGRARRAEPPARCHPVSPRARHRPAWRRRHGAHRGLRGLLRTWLLRRGARTGDPRARAGSGSGRISIPTGTSPTRPAPACPT